MTKKNFIIIPVSIIKANDLSYGAIILLGILNSNSKQLGYAYATNNYYSKKMGCSTRSITSFIKELNDKEYIKIEYPNSFKRKIYVSYKFPC